MDYQPAKVQCCRLSLASFIGKLRKHNDDVIMTSFHVVGIRKSQRTKLMIDYVRDLYKKISENIGETPELFHYDYFKLEGGELYYIGSRKPLTTEGKLKSVGMLADILGKNRLRRLGFNIPVGPITAHQAVILHKAAEELPSLSDITKAMT